MEWKIRKLTDGFFAEKSCKSEDRPRGQWGRTTLEEVFDLIRLDLLEVNLTVPSIAPQNSYTLKAKVGDRLYHKKSDAYGTVIEIDMVARVYKVSRGNLLPPNYWAFEDVELVEFP